MLKIAFIGFLLILNAWVIRKAIIFSKRGCRRRELQHHIDMIEDPHGCEAALDHYEACIHIIEHYGIGLGTTSLGYGATIGDLWNKAQASTQRARLREFIALREPLANQLD